MQLFNDSTFTATVTSLSASIIDAAKGVSKLAATMRDVAAPAYGDSDKQAELAELLTSIKRQVAGQRETYAKWLASHGQASSVDAFKKSVVNQVTYAIKQAGEAAGCKFEYSKALDSYKAAELKLAQEKGANTASGKDANSGEQSAALVQAAEAAPVLKALDKQAHLMGIMSNLITAGYTLSEIEAAFHGMAAQIAQGEAHEKVAASAQDAKAPALLAAMQAKGAKVKTAKKAA